VIRIVSLNWFCLVNMSAQRLDTILIDGKAYTIYCSPLHQYWEKHGNRPQMVSFNTSLNRGYFANWEINDNRLFLVNFFGENQIPFSQRTIYCLRDIFATETGQVFAEWFSGELPIPVGKEIDYSVSGIGPIYETLTTISLENGLVIDSGVFSLLNGLTND
jgi:hypothetical protein